MSASPVIEINSSRSVWSPPKEKSGFGCLGLAEDFLRVGRLVADMGEDGSGVLLRPVKVDQKAFMPKFILVSIFHVVHVRP